MPSVDYYKDPSLWITKLFIKGISLYAIWSTFISGLRVFLDVVQGGSENMLFTADPIYMYTGLALGIIFVLFVDYALEWQQYQKDHPGVPLKFDIKYVVAAVCTLLVASIVSFIVMKYGIGYIAPETEIPEASLYFITSVVIGGAITFITDSCVFKPVSEGAVAAAKVKAQKIIREKLKSEEVRQKALELLKQKAVALNIPTDRIEIFCKIAQQNGVDDLASLTKIADVVKTSDPRALEVFYSNDEEKKE